MQQQSQQTIISGNYKMAYNQLLVDRIRIYLAELPQIEEKEMMGGVVFMYNGKMCVGVMKDELMCRIDPEIHDSVVDKNGCRIMDFSKHPMKGYILVDEFGLKTEEEFKFWMELALAFNPKAKASKERN
jgi:TfoX/Sxy family transcriptional regulator of competence genes